MFDEKEVESFLNGNRSVDECLEFIKDMKDKLYKLQASDEYKELSKEDQDLQYYSYMDAMRRCYNKYSALL